MTWTVSIDMSRSGAIDDPDLAPPAPKGGRTERMQGAGEARETGAAYTGDMAETSLVHNPLFQEHRSDDVARNSWVSETANSGGGSATVVGQGRGLLEATAAVSRALSDVSGSPGSPSQAELAEMLRAAGAGGGDAAFAEVLQGVVAEQLGAIRSRFEDAEREATVAIRSAAEDRVSGVAREGRCSIRGAVPGRQGSRRTVGDPGERRG